jgi:xylulokinase
MGFMLGIDLGTTGCKAVVYNAAGGCLGESYLEYGLITLSSTMIEQDPHIWWALTCQVAEQALKISQVDRQAVKGIAVSSQGISFVLLDEDGEPLGNAINWLDGRAVEECEEILKNYPQEHLFWKTGKRAEPFYVLPKLLWLRKNKPDLWGRAKHILMGHDFLVYKLCGEYVTDHSMAGGTLLYDLHTMDWSSELLDEFEIVIGLLPTLHWSGKPVGTLRRDIARQLGLNPSTVVSAGGQDQKCAALGAGIADGTATVSLGTASAISQIMEKPNTDSLLRVPTYPFLQYGRWVIEGVIGTAAGSLRWYRDIFVGNIPYEQLDEEASSVPCGAEGVMFFPHLGGAGSPHWLNHARGTFSGLSLASTRGHLTRALLEGVTNQIRENLTVTQEIGGPVKQVIIFGGGAKSHLWRQILGDVLDRPTAWTPTVETAGLGAAMLAGCGCGIFSSLDDARTNMVKELDYREPNKSRVELYDSLYQKYIQTEMTLLAII